jgi:nucleoside 2-deoxyribosyltransferase
MNSKLYIAMSLTAASQKVRESVDELKDNLRDIGFDVLPWYSEVHEVYPEEMPDGEKVLEFDLQQIDKCDVFVPIYLGGGSDGRGIELEYALSTGKRIISFRLKEAVASSLVRGLLSKHGISFQEIESLDDIPKRLQEAL